MFIYLYLSDGSFLRLDHHTTPNWNRMQLLQRFEHFIYRFSGSKCGYSLLFRLDSILYYSGRGILLIRNPYRAILSWYKHLYLGVHSDTDAFDGCQGELCGAVNIFDIFVTFCLQILLRN